MARSFPRLKNKLPGQQGDIVNADHVNAAYLAIEEESARTDQIHPGEIGADYTALMYQGGVPKTLGLGYLDVDWFGATSYAPDTAYAAMVDSSVAIQDALDTGKAFGLPVRASGRYRTDSTIRILSNADFLHAEFNCNSATLTQIVVGDELGATYWYNAEVKLPRLYNWFDLNTTWASGTSVGVKTFNLWRGRIVLTGITNFAEGLFVTTTASKGNVYVTYDMGQLLNNKVSLHLKPANGYGWVNENLFLNGGFSHTSDRGTNVPGAHHTLIEEAEDAPDTTGTVTAATTISATVTLPSAAAASQYLNRILRFTSGALATQKRVISSHTTGTSVTFNFLPPLDVAPVAGDTVEVYKSSNSNNNMFVKPSWEGNAAQYFLRTQGRESVFDHARMERHSGIPSVWFDGPLCQFNDFRGGYGSQTATIREDGGAYQNNYDAPQKLLRNGYIAVMRATSLNDPVLYVLGTDARLSTNPDADYYISLAPTRIRTKPKASPTPTFELLTSTGLMQWGPHSGSVDTTLGRGAADRLTMGDGDAFRTGAVAALPAASIAWRGYIYRIEGGTGVADAAYICEKLADGTYTWRAI